jgi:hypothetical protein
MLKSNLRAQLPHQILKHGKIASHTPLRAIW